MIKIHLPKVHQSKSYDCGAAIFKSICKLFGKKVGTAREFIKICKTTKNGTTPENIIKAAHYFGLSAILIQNLKLKNLKIFLDLGIPVICNIQAYGSGHYVAAIGYDENYVYFEDPNMSNQRGYLSYNQFTKRWIDEDFEGNILYHSAIVIANPIKNYLPPIDLEKTKEIPNC